MPPMADVVTVAVCDVVCVVVGVVANIVAGLSVLIKISHENISGKRAASGGSVYRCLAAGIRQWTQKKKGHREKKK